MNEKLKNAFTDIHADESLKRQTFENITAKKTKKSIYLGYKLAPIMAVFALFIFGNIYFTPISYISIDINPSIELEINRFDRVIDVVASNEDAEEIVNAVSLKNMNYIDALETLKDDEGFTEFAESYTEITVVSNSDKNTDGMINSIQNCNFYGENVQCYHGNSELKLEAFEHGISFGKYRAYLELLEVNPEISVDEISGLSMAGIRDLIDACNDVEHQSGYGHNGNRCGK
ncbi:MAG: hypothetical protein R3Y24_03230 [Eubacteriales bacterium]